MRKVSIIILSLLFVFVLAENVMSKDLTPEQLQAMLSKVERQKFNVRDGENRSVDSRGVREEAAGIFRLVERLQSLKARIGTPTFFGTVLARNNLTLNNSQSEKSSLFASFYNIRFPELIYSLLKDRKSSMLSSLPAHISPAGLAMLTTSFLIVALGILLFLEEPGSRFQVQLE